MRKPRPKPGRARKTKHEPAKTNPDESALDGEQEHEGRIDRIERIHRPPGVRAEQADAEAPLKFRDSGDFETVGDAMKRLRRNQ